MATYTAQVLVGHDHPYHGGITPTHQLFLAENDRPAWILHAIDKAAAGSVTWIPEPGRFVEAALLMVAVHVLEDPKVIQLMSTRPTDKIPELPIGDRDTLEMAYSAARSAKMEHKLIVSIFEGSSLAAEIGKLDGLRGKVEVCTSASREDAA